MIRYRNSKAIARWSSADMLGLLMQLGALPAPAIVSAGLSRTQFRRVKPDPPEPMLGC